MPTYDYAMVQMVGTVGFLVRAAPPPPLNDARHALWTMRSGYGRW